MALLLNFCYRKAIADKNRQDADDSLACKPVRLLHKLLQLVAEVSLGQQLQSKKAAIKVAKKAFYKSPPKVV